jgi:hypothetical protein
MLHLVAGKKISVVLRGSEWPTEGHREIYTEDLREYTLKRATWPFFLKDVLHNFQ